MKLESKFKEIISEKKVKILFWSGFLVRDMNLIEKTCDADEREKLRKECEIYLKNIMGLKGITN